MLVSLLVFSADCRLNTQRQCQPAKFGAGSVISGSPGIAWEGDVPVGTCKASPCRVTNSDLAAGPYCRCLKGFYGAITWEGNQSKGQCLPTPQCLENITHATSLASDMHDSRGKLCRAGERLVSLYVLRNLYDSYALPLLFVPMQTCCKVVSQTM